MSGCMTLAQPPDRVSDRRPGPSSIHSPSPVLSASACTSGEDGGLRRSELLGLDWDDVDSTGGSSTCARPRAGASASCRSTPASSPSSSPTTARHPRFRALLTSGGLAPLTEHARGDITPGRTRRVMSYLCQAAFRSPPNTPPDYGYVDGR